VPGSDLRQFIINRELPFDSHQFDLVMCCDVLEHLEHPREVVAELVRICRPGGLVAIVVPDGDVDQFFGHYWFWNAQSLEAMLAPWSGVVSRLPESREFIALIHRPSSETRA
jgi:2-polyprenyl-3-methyl-5-hydroxy-6-metoxy-1,4-benzoquinol methylase